MTTESDDGTFARSAGRIDWPSGPGYLTDPTLCPACFSALSGIDCLVCGLRVEGETSAQLLEASQVAARAMRRRAELIGWLRVEKAASERAVVVPATAPTFAQSAIPTVSVPVPAPEPVLVPAPTPPPVQQPWQAAAVPPVPPVETDAAPAQGAHPRRRSSVQVLLLATGVVLVSVAAVFFLIVAFIANGLVFRSVVIGLLTALAIALAWWLRKRLPATAEGIGALAVAFVYLDVWLVRANDLFGAGGGSATVYWGTALLSASVLFVVWFRLSRLRVASVAAFSTLPIGAGLLAAGLAADAAPFIAMYLGFLAAAVAALAWMLADLLGERMQYPASLAAERFILLGLGTVAAVGATLSAIFAAPDWEWAPAVTLGALVVVGLAHGIPLAVYRQTVLLRGFGVAVCGAVALLPAAAAALVCFRAQASVAALWWPLLLGVVVAVGCDVFAARRASVRARAAVAGAAVGAGLSAVVALAAVALVAALPLMSILFTGRAVWSGEPFGPLTRPSAESIAAVLALATAVVVAAAAWFAGRMLTGPRAVGLAWVTLAGVVFAVPFLAAPLVVVIVGLAIAAAALWALERFPDAGVSLRAPLRTAAILLPALAYVVSYTELWSWALATVGVIGVILAFRRSSGVEARLLLLLAGEAFLLVSVALAPFAVHQAFPATVDGADDGVMGVAEWLALAAAALALFFAVPARRFVGGLERSFGFLVAAVAAAGAFAWQLVFQPPAPGTGIEVPDVVAFAAGVLALAAVVTWLIATGNRAVTIGRTVAALLAAVTLWVAVVEAVRILILIGLTIDPLAGAIVPGAVVLLVAAAGYVSAVLGEDIGRDRLDTGAAALLVGALVASQGMGLPLVLLFGALAALLAAIDADGILGSASWRRHLGWLSLGLGVAALWIQLGRGDVTALEPYVLPLSAALLVVAVLLWSFRPSTARYRLGIAALVFAGLAASLVPLALTDTDTTVRSVVVGIVSALAVGTLFLPLGARAVAERTGAALAGAAGIVATVARHADSTGSDMWLAAGFVVLALGAWGLARLGRRAELPQLELAASIALAVDLGFSGLVALVSVAPGGEVRALVLMTAVTAVAVLGFTVRRSPLSPIAGWTGYAVAVLIAICTLTIGEVDPFELVTVPFALGLLVHGWFRMRSSDVRSWPALGPGLAVLLIPSLLADYGETQLWRAVGLGVVALAVLIAGLRLRWQAPFVFGGVVLVWHAVAQLWPWISALYEAVPWWLWLGIGGAVLIALAARYEHRIQNARTLVASISALR